MRIGVLALQGAFAEHIDALKKLGVDSVELRQKADLNCKLDGLILPGGESTVMGKLLHDLDMYDTIKQLIKDGLPVLSTCAGLILLAKHVEDNEPIHLGLMDITVKRNAYGRQLGSFSTEAEFTGLGTVPMVFIRAPYISKIGPAAQTLATVKGKIIAARQDNMLCTAFHPELTDDLRIHQYFLDMAN